MLEFCVGYNATWDHSYNRPIKNPPPRVFPGGHPLYDEAEWLRGYDAGLQSAEEYRSGKLQGLQGGERPQDATDAYRSGWYDGRRLSLKRQLLPVLKAAGKLGLVVRKVAYGDYDHVTGETFEGGESYEKLTHRELLDACIEYFMGQYVTRTLPTTVDEMVAIYEEHNESEWGHHKVMSREAARKERAEAEYKRIEEAAQHFAAS